MLTTGATATTSGTAQAVIILENYLGSNGTVTVYKGVPHYDYSVTFTPTDFSGTLTTAGNISFEAKGYPQYGNHVTDSALGAGAMNVPGTTSDGCDWFAVNIGSCSGAAIFAAAGTDASPNFHNLWSNDDSSYSPLYCYVASTGTGTTAAATCNTSGTAPATGCTTTCAAGPFVTLASVKAYNNNGSNRTNVHNDLNGVVYCYISTGSPVTYSGWGGSIFASITVKKPGTVMTSVKSAGTCPTYGVAGSDPVNINFDYSGTAANNQLAGTEYVDNISFTTSNAPIWGPDIAVSSAFPAAEDIFDNDIFTPGRRSPDDPAGRRLPLPERPDQPGPLQRQHPVAQRHEHQLSRRGRLLDPRARQVQRGVGRLLVGLQRLRQRQLRQWPDHAPTNGLGHLLRPAAQCLAPR